MWKNEEKFAEMGWMNRNKIQKGENNRGTKKYRNREEKRRRGEKIKGKNKKRRKEY